jgi:2,3-bisphosphoglycerate-dependent phosphoglycerate mutase
LSYLILIRHGESRWNLQNRFTGWVNVPLSAKGLEEARLCSEVIKTIPIDLAFTSELIRAQETLLILLSEANYTGLFVDEKKSLAQWGIYKPSKEKEIPIKRSSKLNERYYGELQGMNKNAARELFGQEQVFSWRRGYKNSPPKGESLYEVYKRSVPYFKKEIVSQLEKGKNILVCAHGNSLRAIIKYIERIGDEEIPFLELATGKPEIYKFVHGRFIKITNNKGFNRPISFLNKTKENRELKKTTKK